MDQPLLQIGGTNLCLHAQLFFFGGGGSHLYLTIQVIYLVYSALPRLQKKSEKNPRAIVYILTILSERKQYIEKGKLQSGEMQQSELVAFWLREEEVLL